MTWLLLGLASAFFLGIYDLFKKASLRTNAVLPVLFVGVLSGTLLLSPAWLLSLWAAPLADTLGVRVHPIGPTMHLLLALKAFIVAASWVLAFFALKHLPISIVAPIRASAPAWTLLGAMVLFDERLAAGHWVGFGIIFASYFMFARTGKREGIDFRRNRWIGAIVAATLIGAASALYDKYLLRRLDPMTVQWWFQFYLVVVLGTVVALLWLPGRSKTTPFRFCWPIPLIGITLVIADTLYFHALADPQAMISMLSVVRRSSVVISFVAGGVLFEEVNRRRKALCLAGILLGVTLILFTRP